MKQLCKGSSFVLHILITMSQGSLNVWTQILLLKQQEVSKICGSSAPSQDFEDKSHFFREIEDQAHINQMIDIQSSMVKLERRSRVSLKFARTIASGTSDIVADTVLRPIWNVRSNVIKVVDYELLSLSIC